MVRLAHGKRNHGKRRKRGNDRTGDRIRKIAERGKGGEVGALLGPKQSERGNGQRGKVTQIKAEGKRLEMDNNERFKEKTIRGWYAAEGGEEAAL